MSVHGHHPARHHGAPGKRGWEQTAVQNPERLGWERQVGLFQGPREWAPASVRPQGWSQASMSQVPGLRETRAPDAWTFYPPSWDSAPSGRAPSLVRSLGRRCPEASSTRSGPKRPAGLFLPSLLTSHSYLLYDHAPLKTNATGNLE